MPPRPITSITRYRPSTTLPTHPCFPSLTPRSPPALPAPPSSRRVHSVLPRPPLGVASRDHFHPRIRERSTTAFQLHFGPGYATNAGGGLRVRVRPAAPAAWPGDGHAGAGPRPPVLSGAG